MEDSEMAPLAAALDRRLEETDTMHHRPLYAEIDWDDRLVCIKGAKGTGKTTMMLQFLKEHPAECAKSFYVSLDSLWFANHSPLDVVEWLHNNGCGSDDHSAILKYYEKITGVEMRKIEK